MSTFILTIINYNFYNIILYTVTYIYIYIYIYVISKLVNKCRITCIVYVYRCNKYHH